MALSTRVLCLLGTDHHAFDRLVSWCDTLADTLPEAEILVQHGATGAPAVARGIPYLDKGELAEQLSRAQVAICHGGPGCITDVQTAGLVPLVVPRDPRRGEHVDGHQQRFVSRFATTGAIMEVSSQEQLVGLVRTALAAARGAGVDPDVGRTRVGASVERFAQLVEPLMTERPVRRRRRRPAVTDRAID